MCCVTGDKEAVVDAAKTAFIIHNQPAAHDEDDDVPRGNGRHDNRITADATPTTSRVTASSNQSSSDNSACPAER